MASKHEVVELRPGQGGRTDHDDAQGSEPTSGNDTRPLTRQQAAFAREYVKDWNATRAALRAGYAKSNAAARGSHLTRNDKVRAAIEEEVERLRGQFFVTRETQTALLLQIIHDEQTPAGTRLAAVKHLSELYGLTKGGGEEVGETFEELVKRTDREIRARDEARRQEGIPVAEIGR